MDGSKFDDIARSLGRGLSRRSVVKGLAGVFAGGMVARQAAEAAPAPKVTICHFTHSETNPYNIITVSNNSTLKHHLNHGDHIYAEEGGCCLDSDCAYLTNQCQTGYCNTETGSCAADYEPVTTLCDDGLFCTIDDHCDGAGQCVGDPNLCLDGVECTVDSCDEENDACVHTPNHAFCNDGNACTNDVCDATEGCVHTDVICDDGNLCTTNHCDPESGCYFTPVSCDDDNTCTDDFCDESTGACIYQDNGTCGETCPGNLLKNGSPCEHSNECCSGCCNQSNGQGNPLVCSNANPKNCVA